MILCLGTTPALQRVMRFTRLSLDAVNRAALTAEGAAGKAVNVAKVLKILGEEPLAMGFLGGARGEQLRQFLAQRAIQTHFLAVPVSTRLCTTVLDDSAGTVTELVEESSPVESALFERLLADFAAALPGCRAAIMSGTIAPGGPPDLYARCTRAAEEAGVLSVVDAQGPVLQAALTARPGLVKPNRAELSATLGRKLESEADLAGACRELQGRGAQRVAVTAGQGAVMAFEGRNGWRIQPPQIRALNPIGSGDAFTATAVWRLVRGENLGEACRWATAAGAANALGLMPGELDRATLDQLQAQTKVEVLPRSL